MELVDEKKLVDDKKLFDYNIMRIYNPFEFIYRVNGLNIPGAQKRLVHEITHAISFIDVIEHMKKYSQLPQDTNLASIPADQDFGGPDALIYSKKLNFNLTGQFKFRDIGK
jgi:hypothetical protein